MRDHGCECISHTKKHHLLDGAVFSLERAMGVEPTSKAWEAFILPMNYARSDCYDSRFARVCQTRSRLGQEHGEVGHELRDVADEDAQDARHDLGVKRRRVMRDDDVGEDGGIGGEVELDEAAVLQSLSF